MRGPAREGASELYYLAHLAFVTGPSYTYPSLPLCLPPSLPPSPPSHAPKVPRACQGKRRILIQFGTPHRALMPLERSNPIPRLPTAQHGLLVVACTNEKDTIGRHRAIFHACQRPAVAGAD